MGPCPIVCLPPSGLAVTTLTALGAQRFSRGPTIPPGFRKSRTAHTLSGSWRRPCGRPPAARTPGQRHIGQPRARTQAWLAPKEKATIRVACARTGRHTEASGTRVEAVRKSKLGRNADCCQTPRRNVSGNDHSGVGGCFDEGPDRLLPAPRMPGLMRPRTTSRASAHVAGHHDLGGAEARLLHHRRHELVFTARGLWLAIASIASIASAMVWGSGRRRRSRRRVRAAFRWERPFGLGGHGSAGRISKSTARRAHGCATFKPAGTAVASGATSNRER
jgi:hypothetical protein